MSVYPDLHSHKPLILAEGVMKIITKLGLKDEVAFGATKLFVKSPKTLFALEMARAEAIPGLVAKIQVRMAAWCGSFKETLS
jgi:myosin-1